MALLSPAVAFESTSQEDKRAEEHATRGFRLAEAGDVGNAEIELRRAVALSPRNANFLAGLASLLAMQQKLREGGAYFEKALKLDPENIATRRNLAAIQWQLGDLRAARTNLNLIMQRKSDDKDAVLLLGLVEENLKQYGQACRLLESVPDQVKQHPEAIGALANSYYRTSQPARARNVLDMLAIPGTDLKALIIGGKVALDARDFQTAEKLLFSEIRADPALDFLRAQLRYRTGRIEESHKILTDLIQQHHGNSATHNLLGWCYYQQGKTKDAVQSFERAIESAPNEESNYLDLATILLRNGRPLVAQALAGNATRRFPNSPRIHEMSGLVATSLGQYTDAVKSYARSVQLDPTSPEAHLGLAVAQSDAGMIPEATATFEQGLQRFPSHAGHYAEYGLMLMKRADAGQTTLEPLAVRLLEKAIELDPALAEPHYQLGNLSLNRGQYERALQHLSMAVKLSPDRSKTHYALGRVYARVGRTQEAADEQQKFATLKAIEDQGKSSRAPVRDSSQIEAPPDKR